MTTLVATPRKVAATATANATLARGRHTPVDASGGARSMALPGSATEGVTISVEKLDASTNVVAVTGSIRGTGSSTVTLESQFESLTFVADSTGSWWPVAGHKTKAFLDASYAGKWRPNRTYAAGAVVLNPSGELVVAKADFTTGSSYAASNWTLLPTYVTDLTKPAAASRMTKGLYARTASSVTGQLAGLRALVKDPNQNGVNGTGRLWMLGMGTTQIGFSDDDGATFNIKCSTFTDLLRGSDGVQDIIITANWLWVLTTYSVWRFAAPTVNGNPGGAGNDSLSNLWHTTVSSSSNGVALPTGTINVPSTNMFPSSGTITVVTSDGPQLVTYTGKTAGTFTGCTGGSGTMASGGKVYNGHRVFGLSDLVNGPAGAAGAGGTNASFRNACLAVTSDESNAFVVEYGTLNLSVVKSPLADGHMAKNSNRLISDGGSFTADMVNHPVQIAGATSSGTALLTSCTSIIQESGPAIMEVSTVAGTAVDNVAITWPNQLYGAGVVLGGPSVYHCANPTAAPGLVAWAKKKTFTQGKHCHAVKIIGGLPWVTVGDLSAQFINCGIWTATSASSPNTWNFRSSRPRGEVAKDPINIIAVTINGSGVVIGESDSSYRDGPLVFADQTGTAARMIESAFRLPMPYSQTMRQLTYDPSTGNIYWFGTSESGAVGPTSCIWMSRAPYTVPVLLEDVGSALDGEAVPSGVISNGYFWIGHYRCVVEKFADQ